MKQSREIRIDSKWIIVLELYSVQNRGSINNG